MGKQEDNRQNDQPNKEKKIIIDEDWKSQAHREKEALAAEEEGQKQQEAKPEEGKRRGPLPAGDFTGLVSMLATQVMFALGAIGVKGEQRPEPDLELAKYHIDMLEDLQTKTKGNLDEAEDKLLTESLHQVRMLYVRMTEK